MKAATKIIQSIILLFFINPYYNGVFSQPVDKNKTAEYNDTLQKFRTGKNIKLMYSEDSPLTQEQRKTFSGLNYFPPDVDFCLEAKLVKETNPEIIQMKTTTDRVPVYVKYGVIHFKIDTFNLTLSAFQNKKLLDLSTDNNQLFVPFRDATSGHETYGGGRYVDCEIPVEGNTVILDFNKAYNPYCAYNPKYSCVIPPEENRLPIRIEAGEKKYGEH